MATSAKKTDTAKTRKSSAKAKDSKATKKNITKNYNSVKKFEGRQYTGMQVGRSHHWDYDQGDWKETKITPDLWEINYAVTKRRKGHAPEGSGVPVGTEYHWYILSHQNQFDVELNDQALGIIRCAKSGWKMDGVEPELVEAIGDEIFSFYE